jgi:subtilisin-like proprotein convertase family protein
MNSVPAGAVVTKVEVGFSITHTYIGDLALNVQAPNGKILNLAFAAGAEGDNYNNVIISSDADPNSQFLPQDSATTPGGLTGTYAADGLNNVGTPAYRSNTSNYSDLFSTPNGTWRLIARDYGAGDEGNITNWYVKVYYTLQPTFTWTPSAGLFIDAGHNTAYTGGSQQTVYAYNTPGNYSYSANISFNGCTESSTSASVDIQAIATALIAPSNNETICSGTAITTRSLSSPSDAGATLNWTRDHTSDVSGTVGNSGTASISGTLINATSSPITVTFTVTPDGSGSLSCSGTPLTFTVTVNPTPLATANPSSQSVCSGSAINPIIFGTSNSLAGTNYTWTRDNTSTATGIAANGTQFVSGILTNTGGTTTVTFSITAVGPGVSACAGTPTTATVTVYNPATVYAMTGTGGTFCSPGAGLPVGLSNSQAGYSYQLLIDGSPAGSPIAGVDGPLSFGNQVQSGTYTVIGSSSGCSTPMSGSVVISAVNSVTPTISLITSNTTICGGTNATFFAIATNTGNNPTYNFTVNGNTMQNTSSNFFISSTLSNGDVVRCTLNSTNTCQTAASTPSNELTMTVNSSTTLGAPAAITGSTRQCTIGGITYLASTTIGGVWTSSNPSVATVASNGKVTAVSNGTTIISYTVSGSNGCTNSASVVYTVAEVASLPAITGSNKVCANAGTITLSNGTTGGVWSANNTTVLVNASTGLVTGNTGNATASYPSIISYKVTNAAGCSKTANYNITVVGVPAVPTITFAPGTSNPQAGAPTGGFCVGKTFNIVGSPSGGAWSSSNSSVFTVSSTGNVKILALGTAVLRYTLTNVNGCTNSRAMTGTGYNCASRGVNLNDAPKAEFDFNLYPNPAKGSVSFNAEFAEAGGRIVLTDMYGKTVKTQMLSLGTNTIDINNLSKGFYLVNIITIDGKKTKKLIVE